MYSRLAPPRSLHPVSRPWQDLRREIQGIQALDISDQDKARRIQAGMHQFMDPSLLMPGYQALMTRGSRAPTAQAPSHALLAWHPTGIGGLVSLCM